MRRAGHVPGTGTLAGAGEGGGGIDDGLRVFADLPAGTTVHVLIANKAYGVNGLVPRVAKLSIRVP